MHHSRLGKFAGAIALSLAILSACADSPTTPTNATPAQLSLGDTPTPIKCPTSFTSTATDTITALGGQVSVRGVSITIPPLAVLLPTVVTVTVPASSVMEIDISASAVSDAILPWRSNSEHFTFEEPVTVSIDYTPCTPFMFDPSPLTVWYWNPASGELLENMNATDDPALHTIRFTTLHLSGYVIAN